MKTLIVIRHAKSSWKDSSLADFERPLNKRGKRNAPEMGARLIEKEIFPDVIVTSPAKRALTTAKLIAKEYRLDIKIIKNPQIYETDEGALSKIVSALDDDYTTVFLVGHNPSLTLFVNSHSDKKIDNLVTAGVYGISFDCSSWSETEHKEGICFFYDFPKKEAEVK